MKSSPANRSRDIERQAGYLQPEHCAPPPPRTHSAHDMWFIRDGCGIVCAVITWLLVLYAEFVVVFVMLLPARSVLYSIINGALFNSLAFLALASHFRAMCTDPGAVPKGNATKEFIESLQLKPGQVVYKCPKCCSIKPDRAHHCSVCKRCIKKMDHHCPWVNNCVGENNQKYFVLFTMYIALISLHALLMVAFHFVFCFEEDWAKCSSFSPPATVILLILLCFEALLFLIFTAVMFGTQVHSICNDETGIEQLKKEERRWAKRSKWMNMKVVFGHPFSMSWMSPFATAEWATNYSGMCFAQRMAFRLQPNAGKHPYTLAFTLIHCGQLVHRFPCGACVWTVGEAGAPGGDPRRHGESMRTPHRNANWGSNQL